MMKKETFIKERTYRKHIDVFFMIAAIFFLCYSSVRLYDAIAFRYLSIKGSNAYASRDYKTAERFFFEAARKRPGNVGALIGLGTVLEDEGKFKQAIDIYEEIIKENKNSEDTERAMFQLALLYGNTTDMSRDGKDDWGKKAKNLLDDLVTTHPGNAEYHLYLGFANFRAINPGKGLNEMKKASELARGREHIWIHKKLMEFYGKINMLDRADYERKQIEGLKQ